MLTEFAPREASFEVNLKGGRRVELTMRPFTLADMAWLQNEFPTEKDQIAIASMMVEPLAKMIWHQMTADSQAIFFRITFQKEEADEATGKVRTVEIKPEGYMRLLEGLDSLPDLLIAFDALTKCRGLNGFLEGPESKKKTISKTRTNGRRFMTWLRSNTD